MKMWCHRYVSWQFFTLQTLITFGLEITIYNVYVKNHFLQFSTMFEHIESLQNLSWKAPEPLGRKTKFCTKTLYVVSFIV